MPIYPGDRVPEDYTRRQQDHERYTRHIGSAGAHICRLLAQNHELVMQKFEVAPVTVMIPNGRFSPLVNPLKDPVIRDTWTVWSRGYEEDHYPYDGYQAVRVNCSERLLVTPQKQFAATSIFPLQEDYLYDLKSHRGFGQMGKYIGRCASQGQGLCQPEDIDAVTSAIEAKVLS